MTMGAILAKQSLEGLTLAEGLRPVDGRSPYLHPSYLDVTELGEDEELDIRARQQKSIVDEGQLVAEIRYEDPPQEGVDVYGRALDPESTKMTNLHLGENIFEKSPGKYHALQGGMPEVTKESVSVSRILRHQGDVNSLPGTSNSKDLSRLMGQLTMGLL